MSNQIWQIEEKGVPQTIAVLLKTYVLEKTAGEEEKQDALSQDREEHERLNWLNLKPSQTIVFVCFGSMGLFFTKQLKKWQWY